MERPTPKGLEITVVGAGIAGLSAALFLAAKGYSIALYERQDKPAVTGAGIQLSPNATQLLAQLGLLEALQEKAFCPSHIDIYSGLSAQKLTQFLLGAHIQKRHGSPYFTLHRADLAQILFEQCQKNPNIHFYFDHTLQKIEKIGDQSEHNLTLHFETAKQRKAVPTKALVAADGVWSKARSHVAASADPHFTGRIAWRATFPMSQAPSMISRQATGLWLGPNAHIVHYPMHEAKQLNVVAIVPWKQKGTPPRGWLEEEQQKRLQAFEGWTPAIRQWLQQKTHWGGWPLYAVQHIQAMVDGTICLIGDAAHAMVPFAAQGGACAIEDAYVLAECCAAQPQDLKIAFKNYEMARKQRVQNILRLSANNGKIYHMPAPLDKARNIAMKLAPQAATQKRMDWLYGWKG